MTARKARAAAPDEQQLTQAEREQQLLDEANEPTLYDGDKTIDELTDAQVLELAGVHGPGVIGQELFDRAQEIRKVTDGGKFGPAITNADFDLPNAEAWKGLTRADVAKIADDSGVSYKAKASRSDIIKALAKAGIADPQG